MDDQRVRHRGDHCHRCKILERVERKLRVEARMYGERAAGRGEQRIPIRRRLRDLLGADVPCGAGAIVGNDLLTERFGELLRGKPSHDVGRATRREGDDHAH